MFSVDAGIICMNIAKDRNKLSHCTFAKQDDLPVLNIEAFCLAAHYCDHQASSSTKIYPHSPQRLSCITALRQKISSLEPGFPMTCSTSTTGFSTAIQSPRSHLKLLKQKSASFTDAHDASKGGNFHFVTIPADHNKRYRTPVLLQPAHRPQDPPDLLVN